MYYIYIYRIKNLISQGILVFCRTVTMVTLRSCFKGGPRDSKQSMTMRNSVGLLTLVQLVNVSPTLNITTNFWVVLSLVHVYRRFVYDKIVR